MATTCVAICRAYVNAIVALTPTGPSTKFAKRPILHMTLREWAEANPGSDCFRKVEINRAEGGDEAAFQDPSEFELTETIQVTVAYPTEPHNIYGSEGLDSLEIVAEGDGDDIRDVISSATNYQSGQNLGKVISVELDRGNPAVWFLILRAQVRYYKSQTV